MSLTRVICATSMSFMSTSMSTLMSTLMMALLAVSMLTFGVTTALAQAAEEPDERRRRAEYVVGVDDRLKISVWGEDQLSEEIIVRPDGMITLPLVNDIQAAGRTPSRLREAIARRLKQFVRDPQVTVIVQEINSFKVYVLGEVNSQGVLSFTKPSTLLEALALAGGLSEYATKKATVVRNLGQSEQRINVDLRRLLSGDPSPDNIVLAPGDVLLVR